MATHRKQGGIRSVPVYRLTNGKKRLGCQMVGEWRCLKLALHVGQTNGHRDIPGMRVHKTYVLIFMDVLRHFRRQLQAKSKIQALIPRKWLLIGWWCRQPKPKSNGAENMPCNTIILAVRVSITGDQKSFHAMLEVQNR